MIDMVSLPKVLVPLAAGTEEMEAVIIIDLLRRAQWEVVVAGLDPSPITASRGVKLMPDIAWSGVTDARFDILMLPGGALGVQRFIECAPLLEMIRNFHAAGKWIGAVCAAPLALQAAGILAGRRVTCHPAVAARLTATPRVDESTVVDGRLVTSQGAGTTFGFALTMIAHAGTPEAASKIADAIVLGHHGIVARS